MNAFVHAILHLDLSDLFDKRNAVDLMERGQSEKDLLDRGFTEGFQAFLLRLASDLRARTAFDDHLADRVGHIKKLMYRRSAAITRVVTRITTNATIEFLALG